MPAKVTAQVVEKNVLAQRNIEVQRRDLGDFATENAKLLSAAKAQSQIEVRRRLAQQQVCQNEYEYEEKIKKEDYERRLRNRTIEQNQVLAAELDKEASENDRKTIEIQRICEESPELRDLEKALKLAYLNKERAAQCEEKILLATRERERIQSIEDQMEADRLRAIQTDVTKIKLKKESYSDQRIILQRQIQEKERLLRDLEIQKEHDREMVNDIVNKINTEDDAEFRKRKEMQNAAAKMIKQFELQRQRELADARAASKAEEDAIRQYNRDMEGRSSELEAKKQAKRDEETRIFQKIAEETERQRQEEEEFNSLRDMLWEEELEAKRTKDMNDRKEKQLYMRKEMMDANSRMLSKKVEMKMQDQENEAKVISIMRRKFAEDEAKERADDLARREARLQYIKLIDQQKNERKGFYDEERARELQEAEEAMRKEDYRKQVINEARKRLLAEHAAKLKGFLPPSIGSHTKDY